VFVMVMIVAVPWSRAIRCRRLVRRRKTGAQITPTQNEDLAQISIARMECIGKV
jgi:hypothetical protein